MSVADNANILPATYAERLATLFSQLDAQQVETFYKGYQHWQLEQQGVTLQEQLATLEQEIVDNGVLMQLTQPSPIALATLTRLQSCGVDDVDLLDSMLERGDTWLDHTLQLLEQCERLDVIHGNYTEWCQHALEGAYEWLDSMLENEVAQPVHGQVTEAEISDDTTEVLLLQKLMSENETVKVSAVKPIPTSTEPVGTDLSRPSSTHNTHEEPEPVGTDSSRPSSVIETPEGRDESVPTIPSILSYPITIETPPTDPTQVQENIPVPAAPVHEIPHEERQQKSPKHGLVSRILARVWQT